MAWATLPLWRPASHCSVGRSLRMPISAARRPISTRSVVVTSSILMPSSTVQISPIWAETKAEVHGPAEMRTTRSRQAAFAPAGQRLHGRLDVFGAPQQFLADRGQPVAGLLAHEQRLAELLFERRDPPPERGGAEPRRAGRRAQAAQPRDVQKQPEVVPADIHFSEMQNPLRPWL